MNPVISSWCDHTMRDETYSCRSPAKNSPLHRINETKVLRIHSRTSTSSALVERIENERVVCLLVRRFPSPYRILGEVERDTATHGQCNRFPHATGLARQQLENIFCFFLSCDCSTLLAVHSFQNLRDRHRIKMR